MNIKHFDALKLLLEQTHEWTSVSAMGVEPLPPTEGDPDPGETLSQEITRLTDEFGIRRVIDDIKEQVYVWQAESATRSSAIQQSYSLWSTMTELLLANIHSIEAMEEALNEADQD